MQRIAAINLARSGALAALILAGCGSSSGVPAACKEGPAAFEAALRAAPGAVRVGETPISHCFTRASEAGDAQALGFAVLPAVRHLATAARSRPHGPAALRLGYLVGAVRRGASDDQGIYGELVRHVESELDGVDTRSPEFRRGELAGRARG